MDTVLCLYNTHTLWEWISSELLFPNSERGENTWVDYYKHFKQLYRYQMVHQSEQKDQQSISNIPVHRPHKASIVLSGKDHTPTSAPRKPHNRLYSIFAFPRCELDLELLVLAEKISLCRFKLHARRNLISGLARPRKAENSFVGQVGLWSHRAS